MTFSNAQLSALETIEERGLAVIWHADEFPGKGRKPWFCMTGGVLPRTLHTLWLDGLIRLDKKAGVYDLAGEIGLSVGRARLTPAGKRAMWGV